MDLIFNFCKQKIKKGIDIKNWWYKIRNVGEETTGWAKVQKKNSFFWKGLSEEDLSNHKMLANTKPNFSFYINSNWKVEIDLRKV